MAQNMHVQQYARAKITRKIKGTALANFTKTCCVVWGDAMIINKYPDNLADPTEDDVGLMNFWLHFHYLQPFLLYF